MLGSKYTRDTLLTLSEVLANKSMIEPKDLIGIWKAEHNPFDPDEELILEFSSHDNLSQITQKERKKEVIYLSYKIEDDELVTDQASSPKEERTKISMHDGILTLRYENSIINFRYVGGLGSI